MPQALAYTLIWSEEYQHYQLFVHGQSEQCFRASGEAAFFSWLTEHTAFAFVGKSGRLSVIQEARERGSGYWYAYRTQARHTRKRYLGRSAQVTLARLEQVAQELSGLSAAPSAAGVHPEPPPPVTLLASKLSPPRLPLALVRRSRLLDKLEAIASHPLTLVSASAGSGKTTLLAAWVAASSSQPVQGSHAAGEPVLAWLSLEELDNDPIHFWTSVIAALRTCLPMLGETALAMLSAQEALPLSTILTSLLQEMEQAGNHLSFGQELVLILDDYHVIAEQALEEAMRFFLAHLPTHLHLVLSSRTDPALPLARLRARGHLLEIRDPLLRFTHQEAASFLVEEMGLPLSEEEVRLLQTRTEGWIAGLQLAALALRERENHASVVQSFAGSHRFMFDYVQQDILDRLPDPLQEFVLQTSILTRLNAALCQSVTVFPSQKGCQEVLEQLERANLFLVPLDAQRQWYRYHDLFREALLARLQASQPERVPLLHQHAARWYEAAGELREAIAHALAASDYPYAASLAGQEWIRTQGGVWFSAEGRTILNWILALPDPALWAYTRLVLDAALSFFYALPLLYVTSAINTTAEGERAITRIEALLQRSQASSPGEAEVSLIARRLHLLQAWIERRRVMRMHGANTERTLLLFQALEALPTDEDVNWNLIPLLLISGLTDYYPEKRAALIPKLLAAKRQTMQAKKHLSTPRIIAILGQAYFQMGRLHLAEQHGLEGLALAEQTGVLTCMIGNISLNLFDVFYAQNRLEEASHALRQGLHIAEDWQQAHLMILGEISAVRLALAQGDHTSAHQALQRMEAIVSRQEYTHNILWEQVVRVDFWLASGSLARAVAWAASVMEYQEAWEVGHKEEVLMLVRVLLAQQKSDQAVETLSRFSVYLDLPEHNHTTIQYLALSLVALHHAGKREQAALAAARLFALTEPEGYIRVYLDAGLPMKEALLLLLETPHVDHPDTGKIALSRPYVSRLLAAFEQEEQRLAQMQEDSSFNTSTASEPPQNAIPSPLIEPLSRQEQQVLHRLVAGQTYAEMAETLVVSPNTIKTQVSSIYRKLGVSRRAEAITVAAQLHLL